jgi:hypothetical protein
MGRGKAGMKITKMICDICKKEIDNPYCDAEYPTGEASDGAVDFYNSILIETSSMNSRFDVCPKCAWELAMLVDKKIKNREKNK